MIHEIIIGASLAILGVYLFVCIFSLEWGDPRVDRFIDSDWGPDDLRASIDMGLVRAKYWREYWTRLFPLLASLAVLATLALVLVIVSTL